MKFLLAAINAKYIHSNLGVYSLKAYADRSVSGGCTIEIGEYTINNQLDDILKDIYRRKPDMVGFSCYIWNITYVMELVRDLPKVLPGVEIWLGGPEVSYDAAAVLNREPSVYGIMMGEGEETFAELIRCCLKREAGAGDTAGDFVRGLCETDGIACRDLEGTVVLNPLKEAVNMDEIPFPYQNLDGFEHKIIYYESSRGCPFSCSYCLSSLDKSVRFRDMELVKQELLFFLEHRVSQVKFVDRTFNCSKKHTMDIWSFITEHDNGVTNFHFEISADLLDEEELKLMEGMRPGLIQLEIGVQSTNLDTIREIHRKTDLKRLKTVVDRVNRYGNIHQHLDLIAGLPYEDYESFRLSFNEVYAMKPEQLQLGFLKVLKGSYMARQADAYGLLYKEEPPYEVLGTKWLDYGDVLRLKAVEDMVEVYDNSGQFRCTLEALIEEFETPFDMFEALAVYYEAHGLFGISHNRMARYEILEDFVQERMPDRVDRYRDLFVYDLYLRENLKSRPVFATDQSGYKEAIRLFFAQEATCPRYLRHGYEGYETRQLMKMAHVEVFRDGRAVLFDYKNRDVLTFNAAAYVIPGLAD